MKDLNIIELSKSYGMKDLFKKLSFTIRKGEYIGLIGQNGSGKSSLMKIIADKDSPDSGTIDRPSDYRIGYLSQDPELNEDETIFDALFGGDSLLVQTVRDYEHALALLSEDSESESNQNAYSRAEQAMNVNDAWQADVQFKAILNRLGITDTSQVIKTLSGGQKKRVGLAQALIDAPDLLLLDEPTNHLDVDAIIWLENYLSQYKGSLLVITHDRYFLDRVTNHILELKQGNIESYIGNFESYLEQKTEREAIQQRMDEKQVRLYKKELAWMRKGAKARTTKQQARISRFDSLSQDVQQQKGEEQAIEIGLDSSRLGKRVFNLEDVSLTMGDKKILEHFNHIFQASDRIGIVGENGSGKSSFLNMLAGQIEPDSGTITIGETVRIGYYRQNMEPFPEDKRMITYLQEIAEEAKQHDGTTISVKELLETFLFPKEMHGNLIRTLSGGEKRRLSLLKVLMTQPNVLFFDEPTNDLDIDTLTVLEDFLESFAGAALVVSHDRYFLDKVVDKMLVIDAPGGPRIFFGGMSDWLVEKDYFMAEQKESLAKAVKQEKPAEKVEQEKTKLTYSEQLEWETIEEKIMPYDEEIETLKEGMLKQGSDYEKLAEIQKQLDTVTDTLDKAWARYDYLSQFVAE